jgi:hypothetical protein
MAVRLSALRADRPLPPWRFPVIISVRGWDDPKVVMRLEGLGQLKNPVTVMAAGLRYTASARTAQKTLFPTTFLLLHAYLLRLSCDCSWAIAHQRVCLQSCSLTTAVSAGFIILAFIRHTTILTSWDLLSRAHLAIFINPQLVKKFLLFVECKHLLLLSQTTFSCYIRP